MVDQARTTAMPQHIPAARCLVEADSARAQIQRPSMAHHVEGRHWRGAMDSETLSQCGWVYISEGRCGRLGIATKVSAGHVPCVSYIQMTRRSKLLHLQRLYIYLT